MDRECPDSRLPGERQSDSFPPGERHSDSCPHAECMTDRFSPNAPYSETYYGSLYVLESFEHEPASRPGEMLYGLQTELYELQYDPFDAYIYKKELFYRSGDFFFVGSWSRNSFCSFSFL